MASENVEKPFPRRRITLMASENTENPFPIRRIFCNTAVTEAVVPTTYPGGLIEHMKNLLEKGPQYDVTFEVEGESISAHRYMLSARSSVFDAELFSPMAEAKTERIKINEMKTEVFKALLCFIYTDQLAIHGSSADGIISVEVLQDLLAAADRYAFDKLRLLCEERLGNDLSVDMVAATLLLADQHSCAGLKNKCLDFVSDPENFMNVALTEGYLHIMQGSPLLFAELSEKVKASSRFVNKFAKRQKLVSE